MRSSARILVVEDEDLVAMGIQHTVTALGHRVCAVTDNGEDAIRKAMEEHPDLVLMDVKLRGAMDGVEAARRVRECIDVPVVFVTAFPDEAILAKAAETAYGYVLKPFDDRDLQVAIVMAVAKHEAFEELESCVQERTQQLSDAIRIRDELMSIASHELKTPLSSLQIQIDLLQEQLADFAKPGMEEWITKRLGTLRRQGDRLDRLVCNLLDIARIVGGGLELELEELDLARVVRDVVDDVRDRSASGRPGADLRLQLPGEVRGRWDALRLEQVVTNLVANAIKYGDGKPIDITLTADDDRAKLAIRDRGIGIAPEDQARIFQRFERAVSGRRYGGLGLGLFIANQIVTAMGGTISVTSRPGQGATFVVDLPRRPG